MHTSEFFLGPDRQLTQLELDDLLSVKAGVRLSDGAYRHLEMVDLVEKGLRGWVLTDAGNARLIAGK